MLASAPPLHLSTAHRAWGRGDHCTKISHACVPARAIPGGAPGGARGARSAGAMRFRAALRRLRRHGWPPAGKQHILTR